jgi:4-alpha-glucanotransferase
MLAAKAGIELAYENARGERVEVSADTIAAEFDAMGLAADNDAAARERLADLEHAERARILPPVLVVRVDARPIHIPVGAGLTGSDAVRWRLILEDGSAREGVAQLSAGGFTRDFRIDDEVPVGYHRLEAGGASVPFIAAPPRCWTPDHFESHKLWGVAAQLYLLRSDSNWGIGDFGDLEKLATIVGGWGASVLGLNPLHAMFLDEPEHASPYAPASRLFLNALNIDLPRTPEFTRSERGAAMLRSVEFTSALEKMRARGLVDFTGVARLKFQALQIAFDEFLSKAEPARRESYQQFRVAMGEALERFAIFQAIRLDRARAGDSADWRQWPAALQNPTSREVKEFAQAHRLKVDFIAWTQWVADSQLAEAAQHASAAGMKIGLYRDLAVGAAASGAESWANPAIVAERAHAGAPPDIFNPAGQDWGLPPFNPRALREESYASFIELVRANLRHAGALRIDHVLGMQHLYWVPKGHPASQGAYVTYPFDDLAAILALESTRNRCLVVGEDLGTVPRGFREKLADAGILSYRVLYFEQNKSGEFVAPEKYPALSLATIGNHDMATLAGWWQGLDIKLHEENNLYPDAAEAARQYDQREKDKRNLLKALSDAGIDVGDGDDFQQIAVAVHTFLARTNSSLAMAQLDNLAQETDQVNLPGSSDEQPNWRRRYSMTLEELAADRQVEQLVAIFRSLRPS